MSTNKRKVNDMSQDMLRQAWKQIRMHFVSKQIAYVKIEDYPNDCIETDYCPSGSGYPQVKVDKVSFSTHQVAALIGSGRDPSGILETEDASHFWCHNKKCVHPRHIIFEDHDVNVTRFCCKMFGKQDNYRCPHTPVCKDCISC